MRAKRRVAGWLAGGWNYKDGLLGVDGMDHSRKFPAVFNASSTSSRSKPMDSTVEGPAVAKSQKKNHKCWTILDD